MSRTMKQKRTTDRIGHKGCLARIERREARTWKREVSR